MYAGKVSYGVTSGADERYDAHAHAVALAARDRAFAVAHTLVHVREGGPPLAPLCAPPLARKNLSVEAGNAIEVITSLITTLHAIRDREFVFHERTASSVHPFPVLSSPTTAPASRTRMPAMHTGLAFACSE